MGYRFYRGFLDNRGNYLDFVLHLFREKQGLPPCRLQSIYSILPFLFPIIMFHELCIPVTMRLVALGHPIDDAKRLADAMMLQLVLLCTLLGFRVVRQDGEGRVAERAVMLRASGVVPGGMFRILPAPAGIAGRSRTLLQS
jgi:hypothetical protein